MDIKELALKVAKEMNWRMDEMTLETFATRLIAAYTDGQEPVAWVPQFSWQRSIDAVACISKRSFDDIPLFTAPPEPAPKQKFPAKPAGPEDQKIYDSIAANYAKGAATSQQSDRERQHEHTMRQFQEVCHGRNCTANKADHDKATMCAAPSSEEVTKMVARLYGDLDGGPSSWLKQEAAAFIERLAARVDDLKQANDGLATAGILPDGCVVVPREATDEMLLAAESVKQYELSTPRLRWEAMIAAWEVKP